MGYSGNDPSKWIDNTHNRHAEKYTPAVILEALTKVRDLLTSEEGIKLTLPRALVKCGVSLSSYKSWPDRAAKWVAESDAGNDTGYTYEEIYIFRCVLSVYEEIQSLWVANLSDNGLNKEWEANLSKMFLSNLGFKERQDITTNDKEIQAPIVNLPSNSLANDFK